MSRDWTTEVSKVYPALTLVVIDPEDRESVERLAKCLPISWNLFQPDDPELGDESIDAMQRALREFANPEPPRPAEPMGLGAVVEDTEGRKWVRADDDDQPWVLVGYPDTWRDWLSINAVRELPPGVQS